jgi:erythromycin esterase-like protein
MLTWLLPRTALVLLLCFALGSESVAVAQQPPLSKALRANRYALTVKDGEMGGPGAPFLRNLLSQAQFVAIGEEHGTREVPQFVWATCRAMAPEGLDAMAIEAGPLMTAKLQQWTMESDGINKFAMFEKQYPDSIAFFYWQQEFDLLSHCQQATAPHTLHLWGLDQEFLGSPVFILQQILTTGLDPEATAIATKILAKCSSDKRDSFASKSWKDACMFRLSEADLTSLQSSVARGGNLHAQELTAALIKTQHIYNLHEAGHPYDANRERALLLKHNFNANYQQLAKTDERPRVLLKFGNNHLYKGFDESNLNDLGNFVTEFADGIGSVSLHIEVLGIRGEDEEEVGLGRPDKAVAKDLSVSPLASLVAESYPATLTVFDLRPLRSEFDTFGHVDRELERLIFGYDLLVVIPAVTAEVPIK